MPAVAARVVRRGQRAASACVPWPPHPRARGLCWEPICVRPLTVIWLRGVRRWNAGVGGCACAQSGGNVKQFKIYRWNPEDGKKPHVQTYSVDLDE